MLRWPIEKISGRAPGFADKRIVLWNRSVGIDACDLAEHAVHALRLHPAFGDRTLAVRDEERAVAAEHQAAAVVRGRGERWTLVIDHLRVLDPRGRALDELAAGDRGVVRAVLARLGVAPVDETVGREVRIEGDVQQPALAAVVDCRQAADDLRRQRAVRGHEPQIADPLGHQHLAAREKGHAPRIAQAVDDRNDGRRRRSASAAARASGRGRPASAWARSAAGDRRRLPERA